MPIVYVNVWEGFGQKNAKTVIQGITGVFVDLGIPKHAVEVWSMKSPNRIGGLLESWRQKGSRMNHHPSSVFAAPSWLNNASCVGYLAHPLELLASDVRGWSV